MINFNMIDFNAFAHGQVQSKLWLCEELEKHLPERPDHCRVLVLGAWYSVLNFMLMIRNPNRYDYLTGMDKDEDAVEISKKLMDAWSWGDDAICNTVFKDINSTNSIKYLYNVVINCSCEHMSGEWYNQVKNHQLICIQTSNRVTDDPTWNITNPNPTMEEFKAKYPMSKILFEGEKVFDYGHLTYSRYMLIGRK